MSSPVTRRLQEHDLDELLRLYTQLSINNADPPRVLAQQTWREILTRPHLIYVGVFVDQTLASTCHAAIIPNLTHGVRPYAIIENVVTDQTHHRRGLGALALRALLNLCWEAGCYKAMLLSGKQREEAHKFYEALGFSGSAKKGFVITRP